MDVYSVQSYSAGACGDAVCESNHYSSRYTGYRSMSSSTIQLSTSWRFSPTRSRSPRFLQYLCSPQPHYDNRSLRSFSAPSFVVPSTPTEIDKRAFRVSAPTVCNSWSSLELPVKWRAVVCQTVLPTSDAGLITGTFNCVLKSNSDRGYHSLLIDQASLDLLVELLAPCRFYRSVYCNTV